MNTGLEILGESIQLGERRTINLNIANLYTSTEVEIPIIIERARVPGPTILITAGIHGDEVNGVEIVRQLIRKQINRPLKGSIICIPVLNVFGFLSMDRNFPDGRDLNRVFPGRKKGSLASQFAYQFTHEILPVADICLDFHTGGASRFNAPQIRIAQLNTENSKLAAVFKAPFTLLSKNLDKSYRATCAKLDKTILLFEGGKSQSLDKMVVDEGLAGITRVLNHLGMLGKEHLVESAENTSVFIKDSQWLRAKHSGMLQLQVLCGAFVPKGTPLATITDPYNTMFHVVKAPKDGYIINTNEAPIVYQGDAIFNLGKSAEYA